jgi:hypothetical protein
MKTNLEKATTALAAGRADEAYVHAWNALGDIRSETADVAVLMRVARALDDPRLLREIERRGLSTLNVPAPERLPRRMKRWAIPLLQALPITAVVIVTVLASNGTNEPGRLHPTVRDTTPLYRLTRPIRTESSGIWLVRLGKADRVDVARLAHELSVRYHLPVRTLPKLQLPRWTLDERQRALVAEQLIPLLRRAYLAQGSAVVIGITDFEIYSRSQDLPYTFSWRAPPRYGVVSTSGLGAEYSGDPSRHVRTRKLVARNIGFLYLHRHEVDDRHSLLRPQMHGVDDIDELDEKL